MGKDLFNREEEGVRPTYTTPSHNYAGEIGLPNTSKATINGEVMDIINSVGHSAPLMIVKYEDNQVVLMPAPHGIKVGQKVSAGSGAPAEIGNVVPVGELSGGVSIFNIENVPYDGGKFCKI